MNKFVKKLSTLVLSLAFAAGAASSVSAYSIPDFPACSNPSGTVRASYASGTHGIVGSYATYTGSDVVYSLGGGNLLQCFCSVDGSGIQTNWWKASSLNQEEIQTLINLGWHFVPDGTAWGLDEGYYLAKNANYSCGTTTTTTTTRGTTPAGAPVCNADRPDAPILLSVKRNGSKAVVTWTKVDRATHYTIAYGTKLGDYPYGVPNTGNVTSFEVSALDPSKTYYFVVYAVNDCMPSEPSTRGGQVLGLATTGTALNIALYLSAGITLLTAGYVLKKTS